MTTTETAAHLPEGFVYVDDFAPSILIELRYAGSHNFVGRPIPGYEAARGICTRRAAQALHAAQKMARARGYTLKIYDAYRPQRASDHFLAWSRDLADIKMKQEFYPNLDKARIFAAGYVMARSGHSRGSTVDLTLVELPVAPNASYQDGQPLVASTLPHAQRWGDNGIDMGTGFDAFDALAHTAHPAIAGTPRQNRELLCEIMHACGFMNYPNEWWHFTLRDEPYKDIYFDFVVR